MPMHDWTTVKAGTYHNFHYFWLAAIATRMNSGILPAGLFAMAEQRIGGPEADLLTLSYRGYDEPVTRTQTMSPPKTSVTERADTLRYAKKRTASRSTTTSARSSQ